MVAYGEGRAEASCAVKARTATDTERRDAILGRASDVDCEQNEHLLTEKGREGQSYRPWAAGDLGARDKLG
jgi:hypothetical protein